MARNNAPDPLYVVDSADPAEWNDGRGGTTIYPWKTLLVGQFFTVPVEKASKLSFTAFRSNASHVGKRHGRKYGVKAMPDGSWQVARTA